MLRVQDIYAFLDEIAPFSAQEKWDNSGLLVGDMDEEVGRVLVTLDIDADACAEAEQMGCELIISHHPVIFQPIRCLRTTDPVYQLAFSGRAAVCTHTPLDIAEGGINDILVQKLAGRVELEETVLPLEDTGLGRIVTLKQPLHMDELAVIAKDLFGCHTVRYVNGQRRLIRRLGICSGSGASMIEEVVGKCDALLTGDVKHDRWYAAKQYGLGLLDCGHYHTEIVMVQALADSLRNRFPELEVIAWEGGDPVKYV